jgi:hypothetical protein
VDIICFSRIFMRQVDVAKGDQGAETPSNIAECTKRSQVTCSMIFWRLHWRNKLE